MGATRQHIINLLQKNLREDGRKPTDYRKISVEYGIAPKSAEGSARVRIGETEVIAGVKLEIGEPYPDKPNEGTLMVTAELLPLSSPEFESGPPDIKSIELARVVDRGIRESEALDFKKLCIKEGEKVWICCVDIYPINDAGNLFDAASLAALAAIKDTKFVDYDKEKFLVNYEKKTNKSLPLKYLPVGVTVIKIGNTLLVDPSVEEWSELDSRLTVATIEDGRICALQKGGDLTLSIGDIEKIIEIATEKAKILRGYLK